VRVTADTFEYADWPSRKPSKKKIQREAIKSDPIGTLGAAGVAAGRKAAERAAESTAKAALRATGVPAILAGARGAVAGSALPLAAAAASAGILAAGYVVMDRVAKTQALKLGDRVNAISSRFVQTQAALQKTYGVTHWQDVPSDQRNKAVSDYKRALATATSQAQGSALVGVRESYH
jgi:hypothetical protein